MRLSSTPRSSSRASRAIREGEVKGIGEMVAEVIVGEVAGGVDAVVVGVDVEEAEVRLEIGMTAPQHPKGESWIIDNGKSASTLRVVQSSILLGQTARLPMASC